LSRGIGKVESRRSPKKIGNQLDGCLMRYRLCRLMSQCLLLAVLAVLPGCKLPSALNAFALGKSSKADDEKATPNALEAESAAYPGVQTSYQAPVSRATPQSCGSG